MRLHVDIEPGNRASDCGDSEMTYIAKDGFVTSILSKGQLFLSAAWCEEGVFTDLLSCGENVTRLFSVLSSSGALAMLSKLYSEAPKHRTAGEYYAKVNLGKRTALVRAKAETPEEILKKLSSGRGMM